MTDQGWYDDPTRRHRMRWYDGSGWSEYVVGPDGSVIGDDLRPQERSLPAPGQAAPPTGSGDEQSVSAAARSGPVGSSAPDDSSATTVIRQPGAHHAAEQQAVEPQPTDPPTEAGHPVDQQVDQQWAPPQRAAQPAPQAEQAPPQQDQWAPPPSWNQPPAQQWSQPPVQQWGQAPQQPVQQWGPSQPQQQRPPAQQQGAPAWQQQPAQAPAWQHQPPQGGAWGYPQPAVATTARVRYLPGPGLAAGVVGIVLLALSLFALKWGEGSGTTFLELAKLLRNVPDGYDLTAAQSIEVAFGSYAAFVLFGLVVVLVVLAGVPLPRSAAGNTYARIAGALVAGLGAVGQMTTVAQAFKGPGDPQFGAWAGIAGWIVVAIGFVLGARRVRA